MKIDYTEREGCKRQLDIEIPGEIVTKEINRASDEMTRYARVPGFRPGKVPRSVIRQRYKQELRQETLKSLVPSAVETAVEQHKLKIVGEPNVEKLDFADDNTLAFTVAVEVLPEFELKGYDGLGVTKRVYKVTDEDVQRVIDEMRKETAELVADDTEGRTVKDGDFVSLDLTGTYVEAEGEHHAHAHDPIKHDDVSIEIGAEGVLQEFNENIRGMKVGEERTFTVAYPAEFQNPALGGHTVEYVARLVAIRVQEIPEFDDAFAVEHGEGDFETADAWRAAVREQLGKRGDARTTHELHEAIIDELLKEYDFAVPGVFVEQQTRQRMENLVQSVRERGIDPRTVNFDWEQFIASARVAAERDVRAAFVIDRIGQKESVEVTEEDIDAEIKSLAEQMDQDEAQIRARLTKDEAISTIRDRIRHRKVLDLVAQSAQTTVEEVEGVDAKTGESEGADGEAGEAEAAPAHE